jgi:recombination associated protein RdgC
VSLVEKLQAIEFLGREFATWLYWRSETGNGQIRLEGIEPFEAWFESPVELVNDFGEATSVVLKGSTPLESPEARQALLENKKIQRAHLRLNLRNQTYSFAFHAGRFAISGLRLPIPPNVPPTDIVVLRLELIDEFERFFESLFRVFLRLRMDDAKWKVERKKLASWIASFDEA